MMLAPLGSRNVSLESNSVITVTRRTVRFAKNVFQTHNISSFSDGEVEIGRIPWAMAIIPLILWLLIGLADMRQWFVLAWLLFFTGITCLVWNVAKPKHYGLLISLNSGEKKLFITSDTKGLKKTITVIYDLLETESESTYQININSSNIQGNFIAGSNSGDTSYKS
jgi:Family of unknown function (DUF6232)